jgi:hypothetical protein
MENNNINDQDLEKTEQTSTSTGVKPKLRFSKKILITVGFVVLVIILGGFYYIFSSKYTSDIPPVQTAPQPSITSADETANWKTYRNEKFGFTLNYPTNWIVGDFSSEPDPKIYFVPTKADITFNPFENTTKVVVAPNGFGSEPPTGQTLSDGTRWAKFVTIKTTPSNWNKSGFVYGSVEIKNLSTSCERNSVIIKSGCDTYEGDRLIYHGAVDAPTWKIIDQILSTFKFLDENQESSQINIIKKSVSPDGSYILVHQTLGDSQKVKVYDKNEKVLIEDIIESNWDMMFTNMKKLGLLGNGMTGYEIKNWTSNSTFVLRIVVADGQTFETGVDVKTGKIIESTFKRIRNASETN